MKEKDYCKLCAVEFELDPDGDSLSLPGLCETCLIAEAVNKCMKDESVECIDGR